MMAILPKYGNWNRYLTKILPGLIFCIVLGLLSRWISANIELFIFNYVIVAILLGQIVKNIIPKSEFLDDGVDFAARVCLYIGIVLLGAQMNLIKIFTVGGTAIFAVAISITGSIWLCGWLGKKIFSNERLGHLVGAGFGVCGISAIIALSPVIKAKDRETMTAVGAALLADIMVLLLLPLIGHALAWSDTMAGFITGVAASNTAQCVAIAHAYSEAAGAVATIVKSVRNAFIPVVILVMTLLYTRRGLPVGERFQAGMLWAKFPKFVIGFLIAAAMSTLGLISSQGIDMSRDLSTWFFVTCFVGIGAGIDLKSIGARDLSVISLGLVIPLILGVYALLLSMYVLHW